nr:hypothetical protein GCM10025730_25800 [Promicromonospora thailandica]
MNWWMSSGGTIVSRSTVRDGWGIRAGAANPAATAATVRIVAPVRTRYQRRRRVASRLDSVLMECVPTRASMTRTAPHSRPTMAITRPCGTGSASSTVPSRITPTKPTTTGTTAHTACFARHEMVPATSATSSMSRNGTTARSGKERMGGTVVTNCFQPSTEPSSSSRSVSRVGTTPAIVVCGSAKAPPSRR